VRQGDVIVPLAWLRVPPFAERRVIIDGPARVAESVDAGDSKGPTANAKLLFRKRLAFSRK
jgi:hypothetical protein